MALKKQFARYVSQNILGMMGISFYILADVFFISLAPGANGVTALNLVLPIFSIIYAFGSMIGIGSAICYGIRKAQEDENANVYFSNSIFWVLLTSVPFLIAGGFFPSQIMRLLGGDATIVEIGSSYARTVMLFTPFLMLNTTVNAFVRNDGDPSLAMAATLFSSIFNVVFDYILMFPLGLGMMGAGLATGSSPVIGLIICSAHFFKKKNTLRFIWRFPSVKRLLGACKLGISAFLGELSSGVTTTVYNWLILGFAGNIGVAAYGVIANLALVATAVFSGIAQGAQPLISESYGKQDIKSAKKLLRMSYMTAAFVAVILLMSVLLFAEPLVNIFNSEQSADLAKYANVGIKLYFIGFLFAGINIAGCGYLSATEEATGAMIGSLSRGMVSIVLCAVIMANILKMTGVWLSFAASEIITCVIVTVFICRINSRHKAAKE